MPSGTGVFWWFFIQLGVTYIVVTTELMGFTYPSYPDEVWNWFLKQELFGHYKWLFIDFYLKQRSPIKGCSGILHLVKVLFPFLVNQKVLHMHEIAFFGQGEPIGIHLLFYLLKGHLV